MIEHYALHELENLTDRFELTNGLPKGVRRQYNITPTDLGSVIIRREQSNVLLPMTWGLVSQGAKDLNSVFRYKTYNTKSEKAFSKASWDAAIRSQRCIIPANGFYMIRNNEPGDVYYFTAHDESLFAVAGIYNSWNDSDGITHESYSMLTIESNDAMPLPFTRMPVLLDKEDEATWLDADMQEFGRIIKCMRPFEGQKLNYRRVSNSVKNAKIDTPELILKVTL